MYYEQYVNYQRNKTKHYHSYRAIESWVVRNLMIYGNCYLKKARFYEVKKDYEKLFGKSNLYVREDGKFLILTINDKAKEKAKELVLY